MHSPLVLKVEVTKRSKVRRNYLSYMRKLTGKSARLSGVSFDNEAVNSIVDEKAEKEEHDLHEKVAIQAEAKLAAEADEKAKNDAANDAVLASREK